MKAGRKRDLTSNPQFLSYSERIAYRAGWMDAAKLLIKGDENAKIDPR